MLEPPGHSRVSQVADGGAEASLGTRGRAADAGKPGRMLGWGRYPARVSVLMVLAAPLIGAGFTVASHAPSRALGMWVAAGTVAAGTSLRLAARAGAFGLVIDRRQRSVRWP